MEAYCQVVFNTPVADSFTYKTVEGCVQGVRVMAPFGSRKLQGFITECTDTKPEGDFKIREVSRVIDKQPLYGEEELKLAAWISRMYLCSIGQALAVMIPGGRRESTKRAFEPQEEVPFSKVTLSQEQIEAKDEILAGEHSRFYLFGITGSGKTEVFLQAAREVLNRGESVIYLVPEIALTHQLIDEVAGRFGDIVAVIHSGLTPSQKLKQWHRLRSGEATIVVGARSAVFAPVHNLGLVIIDEEHETSYKSGSSPRYHARQVAMKRCSTNKAVLVMGSATPSLEAYHLMEQGQIRRLNLTRRLSGGTLPLIKIIDMKKENSSISSELGKMLYQVKEEGRQSILFLNRRGFSYFFHCRSCGFEMKCESCSVSMTLHKTKNRMVCHYCGRTRQPVSVCPDCGSLDVGYSGFGTEQIEEEMKTRFPDFSIARLDTDAVVKRGVLAETLHSFREGKIDILLGTQMVAKGLNFPGVKLVGIVHADTGLFLPDFRAHERTFSLLTQVAGRAGRFFSDGMVLIQTFHPENPAIKMAAEGDLPGFFRQELETRQQLLFPPFTRLFRLVFRGKDSVLVQRAARDHANVLHELLGEKGSILGPAECPIAVISGNHRYQIIARSREFSHMHRAVEQTLSVVDQDSKVYVEVDTDPVSLL